MFVVSAPAGTGKTTLVQMLKSEFSCVVESVSYTTRRPRGKEVNGEHYNFVTEEEFQEKVKTGDFLEYVQLYTSKYGTSRSLVEQHLNSGNHVILVIDTQGAIKLKGSIDHVSIFISPPSFEELKSRLVERKTDSEVEIERRLKWAKHELEQHVHYDYNIINDDLQTAYDVLRSICIAEEHKITKLNSGE
ncbi:MAG: guanylate kinase [Chlamydiota bacterium]|nr:guanylate kinase [Chlamydiota bacterium]